MSKTALGSIREFFAGKGVLLTGSTGFLAKAVVEKLLRDLADVRQIYLLIRPRVKPDGSRIEPRERLRDEVLRSSVFGRLRESLGTDFDAFCQSKITCVSGDLTSEGLGLDPEAYKALASKLNVVINSAATVVFDERIDHALELNTLGPTRLLELARAARACFVHVSTAYVSGRRSGLIPEKLLTPLEAIDKQLPAGVPRPQSFEVQTELKRLSELIADIKQDWEKSCREKSISPESEEGIGHLRRALVSAGMRRSQSLGWSDTYTYTKFMGEQLVKQYHAQVPTVIVRPSIIESSLREPEPGWLDGLRMADPIIIGFGKGRLADFPADQNVVLDIIPADLVVNATLAAAAYIGTRPCPTPPQSTQAAVEGTTTRGKSVQPPEAPFDLFCIASSSESPLVFRNLYEHVRDYFQKHPMTDRAGKPVRVPRWKFPTIAQYRSKMRNRYLRPIKAASFLLGGPVTVPGTRKMRARLRNLNSTLEQLLYYVDIYGPYVTLDCRFQTTHARELLESLTPEDREKFDFDPRRIRWRNYLQDVHIPGIKRNILRMDAPPRAGAGEGHLLDEEAEAAKKRSGPGVVLGVPQTIVDLCARGAELYGRKPLAEIRRGGQTVRISYADMYQRSGELAHRLIARLDLHPGDRIALIGENCPEWALAYLSIARACCTAVPLDRLLPAAESLRLAQLVECKAIIVSPALLKGAPESYAAPGLPPLLNLLNDLEPHAGQAWPYPQASIASRPLRDPAPQMLASILFTSGTTKDPKGVMLSHANLVADALSVAEVLEPMQSDRFMSVLPLHHALEFTGGFLIPMYGGASIYHVENVKELQNTMKLAEITVVIGVPRLFKLFMDSVKGKIKEAGLAARLSLQLGKGAARALEAAGDLSARRRIFKKIHDAFGGHLRLFVSGGAALDREIFHFFKNIGITIVEGYGLTESAPVLAVNPLSAPKAGSVGPAVPGVEIRIDAPDGEGVGRVLARGPMIMQGYWRNPHATEKAFVKGWFDTGDLGRVDKEGYLHITGRSKDVIVTAAGKNVYPDEIEAELQGIPHVKEYCVLGLPARSSTGEEVALVVVPEHERHREAIKNAIDAVNARLPSHQAVARVEFTEQELPKTSTLKMQRAKLRERLLTGAGAQGKTQPTQIHPVLVEKAGTSDEVWVEVARAVAEVSGRVTPAEVAASMKLQMDLAIDSIGRVDLVGKLEQKLGVSIAEESLATLFTVRDLVHIVEAARTGNATPAEDARRERSKQQNRNELQAGIEQTFSKRMLQGMFSTTVSVFMNTYLRVECHGLKNLPEKGPYILVANHCSLLDSVAIREALGKRAGDLHLMGAKDYFFDTRLKSWFFRTFVNALPFDRTENATEGLATCKAVLEAGRGIVMFPEGTRSITGELQPFKPGIGLLGLELEVPIIPVYLRGTYEALPKGTALPRPARIEVRIGPRVDLVQLKTQRGSAQPTELYRKAAAEVRGHVEALANLPPALIR